MSFPVYFANIITPCGLKGSSRYTESCFERHSKVKQSRDRKIVVINNVVCSVEKMTTYACHFTVNGMACVHDHEALVTPAKGGSISADFKTEAKDYLKKVDASSNAKESYQSPRKRKLDSTYYACEFCEGEPPTKFLPVLKQEQCKEEPMD